MDEVGFYFYEKVQGKAHFLDDDEAVSFWLQGDSRCFRV